MFSRAQVASSVVVVVVLGSVFAAVAQQAPSSKPTDVKKPKKSQPAATQAASEPEPVVAASAHGEATIWCVAYSKYKDEVFGTCKPVHIQVGGRARDDVRIGFYESEVGGSGNQWRSAGWSAALAAAQLTDFDPRSMQVSFDYEGRVDGPSAGALMTIGVLAAVRGDKLREDAAMTGTINPDWTVGPVGGIPYKIEGAAAKGKKMILIPAGIRLESKDDGTEIDLIRHGRDLGIEVKPVVDVFAAYKLMTGVDLPRHPSADEPRLSDAVEDLCRSKVSLWIRRFQAVMEDYKKRTVQARTTKTFEMMQKGISQLETATKLIEEGQFGVGYWDAIEGTAYAYLAEELAKDIHAYQLGGRRQMLARVRDNDWLKQEARDVAARLKEELPESLDQLSMYLSACSAFYEALALQATALIELNAVPANAGENHDSIIISASGHQITAYIDLRLAEDLLDFMAVCEGDEIPDDAPISTVATFYLRAAEANMAVFDSLITNERAEAYGITADQERIRLLGSDDEYAIMYGMQEVVRPNLTTFLGDGDAYEFARLAAGLAMYPRSAGLIAKYYSLGAQLDENSQITGVRRERTFNDWLDTLQDRARRSIGFLQTRGHDMSLCTASYEIARVRRSRELSDRFKALNDLLFVYTHAECVRRLAGYKLTDDPPAK